jgi:hypothetical protein
MNSAPGVIYVDMDTVDLGPAAQRLTDLFARVGDDDLSKPTPCPAYSLGDLIDRIGGLALTFTGAAKGITSGGWWPARPVWSEWGTRG